jgi:hypothetical protein
VRRSLPIVGLLALLHAFPLGGGAMAQSELKPPERTSPMHQRPLPRWPLDPPPASDPKPSVESPYSVVVAREARTIERALGKVDRLLSEYCQQGAFGEMRPNQYVGIFADGTLGAAFGHGLGLIDTYKVADPSKIYYFFRSTLPTCAVRIGRNPDERYSRRP